MEARGKPRTFFSHTGFKIKKKPETRRAAGTGSSIETLGKVCIVEETGIQGGALRKHEKVPQKKKPPKDLMKKRPG